MLFVLRTCMYQQTQLLYLLDPSLLQQHTQNSHHNHLPLQRQLVSQSYIYVEGIYILQIHVPVVVKLCCWVLLPLFGGISSIIEYPLIECCVAHLCVQTCTCLPLTSMIGYHLCQCHWTSVHRPYNCFRKLKAFHWCWKHRQTVIPMHPSVYNTVDPQQG